MWINQTISIIPNNNKNNYPAQPTLYSERTLTTNPKADVVSVLRRKIFLVLRARPEYYGRLTGQDSDANHAYDPIFVTLPGTKEGYGRRRARYDRVFNTYI